MFLEKVYTHVVFKATVVLVTQYNKKLVTFNQGNEANVFLSLWRIIEVLSYLKGNLFFVDVIGLSVTNENKSWENIVNWYIWY